MNAIKFKNSPKIINGLAIFRLRHHFEKVSTISRDIGGIVDLLKLVRDAYPNSPKLQKVFS